MADFHLILRRLVFWWLVAFFSSVTAIRMLFMWFQKRGKFFYTNEHPKPKALEEWTGGFVQLSEVKLHYVEAGDKNKPLMVGQSCLVFYYIRPWLPFILLLLALSTTPLSTVVALDMRGYNESDKPHGAHNYTVQKLGNDLIEFIEHFGGNVNLCGHDWGAAVCWSVALRRPEIIRKLVILNVPEPRAFRDVITSNFRQILASGYMFMFQVPCLAEAIFSAEDFRLLVLIMRKSVKDAAHFTDEDAECYKYALSGPYAMTAPINYYRAASGLLDGLPPKTGLVKPKTLIVWGAMDTALLIDGAHASLKYCEQASLKILPNASHFVQEDEPDKVNEYIEEFLKQS